MSHIAIALSNINKCNENELIYTWLQLPATDREIQKALKEIGVDDENEYFIYDFETDINYLDISKYEDINKLNDISKRIEALDDYYLNILKEIMFALRYDIGIDDALDILQESEYQYYSGIYNWEDLAVQLVNDGYYGTLHEHIKKSINYRILAEELKSEDYSLCNNGFLWLRG